MKILHLTSELGGGAGLAALRLHAALRRSGMNSELIYGSGATGIEGAKKFEPTGPTWARYADRILDQRMWQDRRPGASLFTRTRRYLRGGLKDALAGADLIHLHWVAKWLDWPSLFEAMPVGTPIVLTMHDTSFFAGGCHQANGCSKFQDSCGYCPMLKSSGPRDASAKGFAIRRSCYEGRNIVAVPNSAWMKVHATPAALLRDVRIVDPIYPGIDTDVFQPLDRKMCRELLGIDANRFVVCAGSADLSDTNKGMALLLDAIGRLGPDTRKRVALLTYGAGALPTELHGVPVYQAGALSSERLLSAAYSASDVYCTPSQMETFGMTAAEAGACARPVIAFATGGLPEIVDDNVNGRLVPLESGSEGLARAIEKMASEAERSQKMGEIGRDKAVKRFDIGISARDYAQIYERVVTTI